MALIPSSFLEGNFGLLAKAGSLFLFEVAKWFDGLIKIQRVSIARRIFASSTEDHGFRNARRPQATSRGMIRWLYVSRSGDQNKSRKNRWRAEIRSPSLALLFE